MRKKPRPSVGVSRRRFLRGAVGGVIAAAAAPYVLTSSALGAGAVPPASERITIGMIGMGRQARYSNLRTFLNEPDAKVLAVCDVDSWRLAQAKGAVEAHYARNAANATPKCDAYNDFRNLLARDDIDAVMISTPDHWHVPMAIAAARAGKDICCEKPLTRNIAEGRALADAVARQGRIFRTDSEFRSLSQFHRACELVLNGRIGRLHTIRCEVPRGDKACPPQPVMPVPAELDYDFWLGPAPWSPYTAQRVHPVHNYGRPGWMRCRDYCDGMITNWGAHLIDIAQWGNGTDRTGPVEVEGRGTYPSDGLWDVLLDFEYTCRYANGVKLHCGMGGAFTQFEGDDGWVRGSFGGRGVTASSPAIAGSRIGSTEIRLPLKGEKRDFLDSVKTRRATLADAEVGHRTTSVCHLGHIAVQLGRKLRWDPAAERFDEGAANRYLAGSLREPWKL